MAIRYLKGTPGDDFGLSERVVVGPHVFRPGDRICSFDEAIALVHDEVAVCYMDPDYVHDKAHWAIGSIIEVVRWLMDEAAASPRKRSLITMVGLRLLSHTVGIEAGPARAFEQAVVAAIEPIVT